MSCPAAACLNIPQSARHAAACLAPRAGQRTAWRPRPAAHTSGRCARCTRSWRLRRARPRRVAAAARHGPHARPEMPIQAPARARAAPLPHIRGGADTRAPRQQMRASRGSPSPPLAVPVGQAPRVARAPNRAGRPRAAHRQGVHVTHTRCKQPSETAHEERVVIYPEILRVWALYQSLSVSPRF